MITLINNDHLLMIIFEYMFTLVNKHILLVFYWLSVIFTTLILNFIQLNSLSLVFVKSLLNSGLLAIGFYINLRFLLLKYLEFKRYFSYLFFVTCLISGVSLLRFLFDYLFFFKHIKPTHIHFLDVYPISLTVSSIFIIMSANAYFYTIKSFRSYRINIELEKEKIISEMNFLKSQINPHFFFNTLNNLYSLAYAKSDKTADSILKLSNLMRYMLYDCKAEFVTLKQEMEYIRNYIEIIQLQSEKPYNITFTTSIENINIMIPPLVFTTFIENAFKHSDIQRGGYIRIEIITKNDTLRFTCINGTSIKPNKNISDNCGLGLENVLKRLNLLFPKRHQLNMNSDDSMFSIELDIKL